MKPVPTHCCSGSLGRDDVGVPEVRWGSRDRRVLGRGGWDAMLGSPPMGEDTPVTGTVRDPTLTPRRSVVAVLLAGADKRRCSYMTGLPSVNG